MKEPDKIVKFNQEVSEMKSSELCCNKPKEKHGHTAMYEHYKYCGNCGKDLL